MVYWPLKVASALERREKPVSSGFAAVQALCLQLRSGNWRRIQAAANALGRLEDPRALDRLRPHLNSTSAEVYRAASQATGRIEPAQAAEDRWLQVDSYQPYDQVKRVWSQLDDILRDNALRQGAIRWHREFAAAMPDLAFASAKEQGHTWAMLGTLIFCFLNPRMNAVTGECPEATHCHERCLQYTPDRGDIRSNLARVRPPA